ncbi:hypothetical protein XBKB1_660001 [Xenorhabdus bovienii str. kraussei Becker Underwood]|uniref:Uncharacterized protein n=1 Tax=Xenorhabdus bovienii str. kraussei Becker Underwood TaxID=1398204 RepID=A0A077Q2W5_XENBV|nr:hypothetical protein XBKB1_660001 [Xenorhabdus bovienii str. kraussei Becker Underwood]
MRGECAESDTKKPPALTDGMGIPLTTQGTGKEILTLVSEVN